MSALISLKEMATKYHICQETLRVWKYHDRFFPKVMGNKGRADLYDEKKLIDFLKVYKPKHWINYLNKSGAI